MEMERGQSGLMRDLGLSNMEGPPVDFLAKKQTKDLGNFQKDLATKTQEAANKMSDRVKAYYDKFPNTPQLSKGQRFTTPKGSRVEVISAPYMAKNSKEPMLKVDIIGPDGDSYVSSMPISAFDTFNEMGLLR